MYTYTFWLQDTNTGSTTTSTVYSDKKHTDKSVDTALNTLRKHGYKKHILHGYVVTTRSRVVETSS